MKKLIAAILTSFLLASPVSAETTWPVYSSGFDMTMFPKGQNGYAATSLALDSAYTYASAGDAIFYTFVNQKAENLTDFQLRVLSYTGTWANTDGVINVEIREGLNGSNIPGTTLTGSFTVTLDGSTTGWIHKSGLSIALAAGKFYTVVVADADGGAADYVTITYSLGTVVATGPFPSAPRITTNGWSTAGTQSGSGKVCALKIGSHWYASTGPDTTATTTSGTYERGMRFRPTENCTMIGVAVTNDSSILRLSTNTFKVYADGTNPGGATLLSVAGVVSNIGAGTSPVPQILLFPDADRLDLTGGTWYRFSNDMTVATTVPRKSTINGSPDADLLTAMLPFNGDCYWIEEAAGPVWTEDTASIPTMAPILVPNTDSAGGAGGFFIS